jgi:hypothetical protein
MCACGDPTRPGIDHTTHVCITSGLFDAEDFTAIEAAANKEETDGSPRHNREP